MEEKLRRREERGREGEGNRGQDTIYGKNKAKKTKEKENIPRYC